MNVKTDLVLRIKAGVEAAYLSDDMTQAHRLLGRVDDDVMRLHDLLCAEPSPVVEGLTEDDLAAMLSTAYLTGARRTISATSIGEACECNFAPIHEVMEEAESMLKAGAGHPREVVTASFLTENKNPEAWRTAVRTWLGKKAPTLRASWQCAACDHEHRGDAFANICVGCTCPHTAPQ